MPTLLAYFSLSGEPSMSSGSNVLFTQSILDAQFTCTASVAEEVAWEGLINLDDAPIDVAKVLVRLNCFGYSTAGKATWAVRMGGAPSDAYSPQGDIVASWDSMSRNQGPISGVVASITRPRGSTLFQVTLASNAEGASVYLRAATLALVAL